MTHLTEDMLADLSETVPFAQARKEHSFERMNSLRAYAAAGKMPLVDGPAWDPDEELV